MTESDPRGPLVPDHRYIVNFPPRHGKTEHERHVELAIENYQLRAQNKWIKDNICLVEAIDAAIKRCELRATERTPFKAKHLNWWDARQRLCAYRRAIIHLSSKRLPYLP